MKRLARALILSASLWIFAPAFSQSPTPASPPEVQPLKPTAVPRPIFLGDIKGTINPATDDYLIAAIRRAERENAQALVITIDTPGGLLTSTHTMAQAMDQSKIPVVLYVTPAGASATSAGALLMLASHVAAMTPGSHMGAAHPVAGGGTDISGDMREKAVSDTVAFAQSMAEVRGRNRELAALIVSKSQSFTAKDAQAKGLIEILADSEPHLIQQLHGRTVTLTNGPKITLQTEGAPLFRVEMTVGQKLLNIISNPNIAAILATLAMLLIYVELQAPGIQIAGALGVIFFIVSFMSFQTLPIRVGAVALMALGLALMMAEVFATANGVLAIGGVISFTLGMIWIVDPAQTSRGVSAAVWIPASIALGTGALLIGVVASRIKKQSRLAREAIKGGGIAGLEGYEARVDALSGGALMSPFGTVTIRGEIWEFAADEPVRVGEKVSVEKVNGLKLQVKKIHS